MDWPKGEPGSSPGGASAVTRSPQQAQRPPNRRTWPITSGRNRRQLDALVDLLRGLRRVVETVALAFPGQVVSRASITWSGFGCSVRPTAGAALAGWALAAGLRTIRLPPLRRRFGGVVRRLGQPRSVHRSAPRASFDLLTGAGGGCANSAENVSPSFSVELSLVRSGGWDTLARTRFRA